MAFRKKVRHLENQLNAGQVHDVAVRRDLRPGRHQVHHDRAHLCRNPGALGHDLVRLHLVHAFRATASCVLRLPFSSQYRRSVAGCETGMNLLTGSFWTENCVMVKRNFQTLKNL